MRWDGHLARIGEERNTCTVLSETLKGRDSLEELRVDRRITNRGRVWTEFI
jgi:hypothetical protein